MKDERDLTQEKDFSKIAKDLNNLIDMEFEKKVKKSLKTIKHALHYYSNPVISSSFGKDSVVLIHLVHRVDDSVPIIFNDTGVGFPETKKYMKKLEEKWELNIDVVKPKQTFFEIVDEYGYPKTSRASKSGDPRQPKCCKILKEEPMQQYIKKNDIDLNFVGLCAYEGNQRRWAYIRTGNATYYHKTWDVIKSIPLIWWELDDVWNYIDNHDIPKNPVYEKYDLDRTGCITCSGHKNWKKSIAKYSQDLLFKIIKDKENIEPLEKYDKLQ